MNQGETRAGGQRNQQRVVGCDEDICIDRRGVLGSIFGKGIGPGHGCLSNLCGCEGSGRVVVSDDPPTTRRARGGPPERGGRSADGPTARARSSVTDDDGVLVLVKRVI